MGGVGGGGEARGAPAPASFLDARDGDRQRALRADEHGHVQDAVLLRAEQLLAVVEKHVRVGRVHDCELGHGAGVADLVDAQAERQRVLELRVLRYWRVAREERCEHDAAVFDRVAELED